MTDKMREEFEAWASKQRLPVKKDGVATTYAYKETDIAWQAWKASRAAVVVELLPEFSQGDDYSEWWNHMRRQACISIGSAGLRVKQ